MIFESEDYGIFVGQRQGHCIRVSIPGQTGNDWANQSAFLDLPLMDEDTYMHFVECLVKFKDVFRKMEVEI